MSAGLFAELKRRNVIRMAGLYAVGAWLITQVAGTVLPMYEAPAWLPRAIVTLLAIGFLPTMILSWEQTGACRFWKVYSDPCFRHVVLHLDLSVEDCWRKLNGDDDPVFACSACGRIHHGVGPARARFSHPRRSER
jgi:hypothetical protein